MYDEEKCYRLVFRAVDRVAGSAYANPIFYCQLPENLYKDGTNKKIKVYLEYAGVSTDGTDPHDAVLIRIRNFAVNGSQTKGAGKFEGLNTLGIATIKHQHGNNEMFCATEINHDMGYLEFNAFQFNQGKIEFMFENMDGTAVAPPNGNLANYVISLIIKG